MKDASVSLSNEDINSVDVVDKQEVPKSWVMVEIEDFNQMRTEDVE